VRRKYWVTLASSAFVLLCLYLLNRTDNPDAATLGKRALGASKLEDRMAAASLLGQFLGEPATDQMKLLVKESKDPEVVRQMLGLLAIRNVTKNTWELFIDTLNSPDTSVRAAAWEGVEVMLALTPEEKASFKPNDPAGAREPAIQLLKEKYLRPQDPNAPPP
jgi:hypothetical protein